MMVSVGAPLVEELYYRGVAQRTAVELAGGTAAPCVNRRSALGAAVGIGAVAVFFALSHINSGADDSNRGSIAFGGKRTAMRSGVDAER